MSTNPNPLILTHPPSLHPTWVSHIPHLPPPSTSTSAHIRKSTYIQNCLNQNTLLLRTSLTHLTENLLVTSSSIPSTSHDIPTRLYTPSILSAPNSETLIIYFHGGGLYVGDLDSEDLTCRELALSLSLPLLSISYRLLPEFGADDAVSDALASFTYLSSVYPSRKFILVGSSSGGQLAATIALNALREDEGKRILGVMLRCPVTCDATDNGISIPEEWKNIHTSMKEEFYTGILDKAAVTKENRVREYNMPLEVLAEMPRLAEGSKLVGVPKPGNAKPENIKTKWFLQLCTNDIYYSDGICLGIGLRDRGYDVKIRVEVGWPHTFWLKGMVLDAAQQAEMELVKGAKWVLDDADETDIGESRTKGEMNWVEWSEEIRL
ncbi:hypothetical protein EAF04_004150 [Stromatinia cepivora]|nr:hypothetical protein EAF04_004150 [Stromatinia cepivora]